MVFTKRSKTLGKRMNGIAEAFSSITKKFNEVIEEGKKELEVLGKARLKIETEQAAINQVIKITEENLTLIPPFKSVELVKQ